LNILTEVDDFDSGVLDESADSVFALSLSGCEVALEKGWVGALELCGAEPLFELCPP